MVYVVDSDQVAKLHVCRFFFFRYSTGPYEGIAYCVCVAECVDNSREQVHICTEVAIFTGCWSDLKIGREAGRALLKGVDAFCFCNLIWDSVPQARAIGEDSALVCQSMRVWYAGLGIQFLLLAGACMMWSDARMSTRP